MTRSCKQKIEHIDRLPEDLVRKILLRLPIKDAVKTSVLSRKWRYAWTELPRLIFDDRFCEGLITTTKSKITLTIYQVLCLHRGPLDLFELSSSTLESCPEIDHFVLVVLKAGIKNFTLKLPTSETYRLPSSIFSYGQQLEALNLRSCELKPPTGFNGFKKLVRMELVKVCVSGCTFSDLISHCPLLKELYIFSYANFGRFDIVSLNLEKFVLMGLCESLCFMNTPKLATVGVGTYNDIKKYVHNKIEEPGQILLCGRIPVVENLILNPFYCKNMYAHRASVMLLNDLWHLNTLHLGPMCFGFLDEVSSALSLVKNSKNLKKLTITVYTGNDASDVELKEVEGIMDVTLDHLLEFKLLQASGSKCELQFIEFVLAKSPMLEKCLIRPNPALVDDKGCRFFKDLSRFRRASPNVEISYLD